LPDAGFSGDAAVTIVADDGFSQSSPQAITISVSDAPLLRMRFEDSDDSGLRLHRGESAVLRVTGDFADQAGVELPGGYVLLESLDPAVVSIGQDGRVHGAGDGGGVVRASRGQLSAVEAVRVGDAGDYEERLDLLLGIDVYPGAVVLMPGQERQITVKAANASRDVTSAAAGTRYFSANEDVLSVSDDGRIDAHANGDAIVTAVFGAVKVQVSVIVETPPAGARSIGLEGGIVSDGAGSFVALAPGALPSARTVACSVLDAADMPIALPVGFDFVTAFELDFGAETLAERAQIAIDVPDSLAPGTRGYFMRAASLPDANGSQRPVWLQVEEGVVASDGRAYTTSPPWPGVEVSGTYMFGVGEGSVSVVNGKVQVL
jgi:hypothetical protein